ncbi:MAG: DMT family transporter [Azospirillaceae bacterium]
MTLRVGRPAPETAPTATDHAAAFGWLITDMVIMTGAMIAVKWMDGAYPPLQLVFLRSAIGLVLMLPWLVRHSGDLRRTAVPGLHLLRVLFSMVALAGNFYAIAALPLAEVTAISHLRPLILTALAYLVLGERVLPRRWLFAGFGVVGLMIMVLPDIGQAERMAWAALGVALVSSFAGEGAVITQKLITRHDRETVLMAAYTIALTVLSAVPALLFWQPVAAGHWPLIAYIGVSALAGQYCFVRAHRLGDASFLSGFSGLRVVLAILAGLALFGEVPTAWTVAGAAVIVTAATMARRAR